MPVKRNKLFWIVPAIVLTLGATATWWSLRGPRFTADNEFDKDPDRGNILSQAKRDNPLAYVKRLTGKDDAASVDELIKIYAKWAPYPDTLAARRMAMHALLAHPNVNIALESILAAVDGDQTRREQDPLWRELVQSVGKLWDAVTFPLGRNRMYIEEREKPKALLIESLAEIRPEKLSDEQRVQVAADFIDLHPGLAPDQKTSINRALSGLGNSDVVEILAGRGLGENSHLKVVADRNHAIESARTIRLPQPVHEVDVVPPVGGPPSPAAVAAAKALKSGQR